MLQLHLGVKFAYLTQPVVMLIRVLPSSFRSSASAVVGDSLVAARACIRRE